MSGSPPDSDNQRVAAVDLPPAPLPSPSGTRKSIPSFLTTAAPSNSILPQQDLQLANTDITTMRTERTSNETINKFAKSSPDLSAAVSSEIRMAITSEYTLIARNMDGTINEEATRLGLQLIKRMDFLHPTAKGFNPYRSLRSNSEALARDIKLYGSAALELVLGKDRLPQGFAPMSTTKIKFRTKQNRLIPYQVLGAEEISLDYPTFFYVALDQDLTQAYSDSPVQSAIQPIQASVAFLNDLRRVFRKAIQPRNLVTIDSDKWRNEIPVNVKHDQAKLEEYMNTFLSQLETQINGLEPEECIVAFDTLKFELLNNGNVSLGDEYSVFSQIVNSKIVAGTKSNSVVLGHDTTGSTNIASTQSMLSVKSVEAGIQEKLNEIYSRAFTQAIRLFGIDVYAEFKYKKIDLRPELELEAFKAMQQSRSLELLSLGLLTDAEASIVLTGTLPPAGYKPLSGTMFTQKKADTEGNPTSNTSGGEGSALNQNLNSTAPKQPKSANKKG